MGKHAVRHYQTRYVPEAFESGDRCAIVSILAG